MLPGRMPPNAPEAAHYKLQLVALQREVDKGKGNSMLYSAYLQVLTADAPHSVQRHFTKCNCRTNLGQVSVQHRSQLYNTAVRRIQRFSAACCRSSGSSPCG